MFDASKERRGCYNCPHGVQSQAELWLDNDNKSVVNYNTFLNRALGHGNLGDSMPSCSLVRVEVIAMEAGKPKTGPTLRDVAAYAGVSPQTVSVVLNDAPSRTRVSDATRSRIQEAARLLHYYPNLA